MKFLFGVAEFVDGFCTQPEFGLDDCFDLTGDGQDVSDLSLQEESEIGEFKTTGQVPIGDRETLIVELNRDESVMKNQLEGDLFQHLLRDDEVGERVKLKFMNPGESLKGLLFCRETEIENDSMGWMILFALIGSDELQLVVRQNASLPENIAKLASRF